MRDIAVCISNSNKNVSVIDTIDSVKRAGFKNVFVQWYDSNWEISQQQQVDYCKKVGLNIIFAHLGYQNINSIWEDTEEGEALVARYKKNIKDCKENGITTVVMHLTSKTVAPAYNEIGLNRIRRIVEYAKDEGVKVAFENTKIKGYIEYVLENIKDDNVGMCFDSGHFHVHFKDEFNFDLVKNRIFAVHLHDNDQTDDLHLLPYDGTLDWDNVISKLNYCNYTGPVTLELIYRRGYLEKSVDEFFKEGHEIGEKLRSKLA